MADMNPRLSDTSKFPDPVYKETVLRPLFDGAKNHHVDGFRRIDRAHLETWCDAAGWETVLNRAGKTFKKLDDSQKADLTRERAIGLMLEQPSMIKRPVLEAKGKITVGFKPEIYQTLFA